MEKTPPAQTDPISADDAREELADDAREELADDAASYDYLRLTMIDLMGIGRSRLVTRPAIPDACRHGVAIGYSANVMGTKPEMEVPLRITKLGEKMFGNGILRPIPGTLHPIPYGPAGTDMGEVLCELCWEDGIPLASDPRHMALNQLKRLEQHGYHLYSSYETEVTVVDPKQNKVPSQEMCCFANLNFTENADWLVEIDQTLSKMGVILQTIDIELLETQFEFNPFPQMGIQSADEGFLIKQTTKEWCARNNLEATFMAKPFPDVPLHSTGIHFNHSLWTGDKSQNVFWKEASGDTKSNNKNLLGESNMSAIAQNWLAGLVHHSRALTALYCPTVNCYRRSCPEPDSPSKFNWGFDNRMASYRVKARSPSTTYIENRLPSGACNPYIVMAATIAAGLDGVLNQLKNTEPDTTESRVAFAGMLDNTNKSDIEQNIDNSNHEHGKSVEDISGSKSTDGTNKKSNIEETRKQIESHSEEVENVQPIDLMSALQCLKDDKVLVKALGEEFVEWYVIQRQVECEKFPKWNENRNNPDTFLAEKDRFYRYL